jgi:hypothetical protein
MHALFLRYSVYKATRSGNDGWPKDITDAIENLKPSKKGPKLKKWWRDKGTTRTKSWKLCSMGEGDSLVYYFERDDKPVVSTSMIAPLVAALHDVMGHRSATSLTNLFQRFFCTTTKGTMKLVRSAADSLQCESCRNEKVLPKREHTESIRVYEPDERWQIDHVTIASKRLLKRVDLVGKHGYRHILCVIDCFSKKGWVIPCKTLGVEEVMAALAGLFTNGTTPDEIQSDNHKSFRSPALLAFLTDRLVAIFHGGTRTPQHQGQDERFNRTIKTKIFTWIRANLDRAAEWYLHVPRFIAEYNDTKHHTTNLEPDRIWQGRLRTPVSRKLQKERSKVVIRLLDDKYGRFDALSSRLADQDMDRTAEAIARAIDLRQELQRYALAWTGKKQTANRMMRMRQLGGRVKRAALLEVGAEVTIPRPSDRLFKNQTLTRNVTGQIIGSSMGSLSYHVQYRDHHDKQRSTWVGAEAIFLAGGVSDIVTQADPCPPWKDVQRHVMDFAHRIEVGWRNTRSLTDALAKSEMEEEMARTLDDLLEDVPLPDRNSMTAMEHCELVMYRVLDSLFMHSLKDYYANITGTNMETTGIMTIEDVDILLMYTCQQYGYNLHMTAVSRWRRERLQNPTFLYPMVLGAVSGREHECSKCDPDKECQPEHVCCLAYHVRRLEGLGWAQKRKDGKYIVHYAPQSADAGKGREEPHETSGTSGTGTGADEDNLPSTTRQRMRRTERRRRTSRAKKKTAKRCSKPSADDKAPKRYKTRSSTGVSAKNKPPKAGKRSLKPRRQKTAELRVCLPAYNSHYVTTTTKKSCNVFWVFSVHLLPTVLPTSGSAEKDLTEMRRWYKSHKLDQYLEEPDDKRVSQVTTGIGEVVVYPNTKMCYLADGHSRLQIALDKGVHFFPITLRHMVETTSSPKGVRHTRYLGLYKAKSCDHNVGRRNDMRRNIVLLQEVNYRGQAAMEPSPWVAHEISDGDVDEVHKELKDGYWLGTWDLDAVLGIIGMPPGWEYGGTLGRNELVPQVKGMRDGKFIAIVNTDRRRCRGGGVHWVVAVWSNSKSQVVIQFFDPRTTVSLCAPLERCVRGQNGWQLLDTLAMEWQRDGWRCGYFTLYAVAFAEVGENNPSGVGLRKMPDNFPQLVYRLLGLERVWKRGQPIRLTKEQRAAVGSGQSGVEQVLSEL